MTAAALWARIGIGVLATAVASTAFEVESPGVAEIGLEPALALGIGTGAVLFVLLAQKRPTIRLGNDPFSLLARLGFLALWAAIEETVWRWLILGELAAQANVAVALLASAAAFGWLHRNGRVVHALTGLAFGTVYVLTGRLGAAIVAHLTYNLLVASELAPARREAREA